MRKCAVIFATLLTPVLIFASPKSSGAAEESSFFLQDQGTIRVLRGLNPDQNFEAATLPKEIDLAPAAAPATQAEPPRPAAEPERKTTRQLALERTRERGIPVIRAGARRAPGPEVDSTRRQAIERSRQRGITVNRAGG